MLVLTRRLKEVVIIGEGDNAVRLEVTKIGRDKVSLGFEAREDIRIDRLEVREEKGG